MNNQINVTVQITVRFM